MTLVSKSLASLAFTSVFIRKRGDMINILKVSDIIIRNLLYIDLVKIILRNM